MPDLSVSRQDVMAGLKCASQSSGLDSAGTGTTGQTKMSRNSSNNRLFQHDKQKMTMANSFFQAVIKGSVNKVKHQLSRGHNINSKNDYGMSPLVAALHIEEETRRCRMFCLLLERGCSYKTRDISHDRPVLHWACVLGQEPEVKILLEETAGDIKLSEKDGEGYTALHHAVKIGSLPIVQSLVDYHVKFGVSVDLPDKMGLTPYIHARRLGYRDVANILREQGLASLGHGDNLFRSPREWSQIGKFERKKAIELSINDQVNAAKVLGKLNLARLVGNSPRMAVPGIVVPSFVPDKKPKLPVGIIRKTHHISVSLPSLADAINEEETPRPSSAEKGNHGGSEHGSTAVQGNSKPGPPKIAFENDSNKSSIYSYSSTTQRGSMTQRSVAGATGNSLAQRPIQLKGNPTVYGATENSYNTHSSVLDYQGNLKGLNNPLRALPNEPVRSYGNPQERTNLGAPVRTNSNLAALSLLEQSSFQRGRLANSFHQSHFDTSKASEYGHMMGNLSSFMDVLAQQQTKSFRKSVEVKKPVTPPKPKKKKSKVSSLAIILGKDRGGRKRGSRSPKSAKNARNKGDKEGKSKGKAANSGDGKENSKPKNSESKGGRANKLPVPTIKLN